MITRIRLALVTMMACLLTWISGASAHAQVGFQLSIGPYPGIYSGLPYGPFGPPIRGRRSFYLPPPPLPAMRAPSILVPVPGVSVQRYSWQPFPSYSAQSRYYSPQPQYPNQDSRRQYGSASGLNDLRPGMVLPDGATVLSVDPIGSRSSTASASGGGPTPAPPPVTPASGNEPRRAAF
jgi:hypothetical protein